MVLFHANAFKLSTIKATYNRALRFYTCITVMYLYAAALEAAAQTVFMAWLRACFSTWGWRKVQGCYEHGNESMGSLKWGECLVEKLRIVSFWRILLIHVIIWLVRYFRSVCVCVFCNGWGWKTDFFLNLASCPLSLRGSYLRYVWLTHSHMWPHDTDQVDSTSVGYAGVKVFGSRLV